jgi:hypothetical protein
MHCAYSQYMYGFIPHILCTVYEQIHFVHSQYTNRLIPPILSIYTDSFHVFLVYEQIHFVHSQYTNRLIPPILSIYTESFHVFLVYEQIHFVHSQYTNRLIPPILSIYTDSFHILWESGKIILNIRNIIIFFTAFKGVYYKKQCVCVQLDQRTTRNNQLFSTRLTNKFLSSYSNNMQNDLQIRIYR